MDLQLAGKKAVVTGGSRGIGKAIARELAAEGCDVVIGARTESTLREAADEIAAQTGRRVVPLTVDMADAASIQSFVAGAASALGGLDILVNNAARVGGSAPDDLDTVTDELLLGDFTEKTMGYFRTSRAAIEHMKASGWGRIVNIGGVTVRTPSQFSTPARNAAMIVMSKTLANAVAKYGITVNVVHPGLAITERMQSRFEAVASRDGTSYDDVLQQQAQRLGIGRMVTAEDLAKVVVFLCSPLAFSISGEAISAAGGQGASVSL
jgi:NAD(P)-dependent dehydrogenase (short-subunit alcohol dehydrogenase family)